jgi:hypothetical protein
MSVANCVRPDMPLRTYLMLLGVLKTCRSVEGYDRQKSAFSMHVSKHRKRSFGSLIEHGSVVQDAGCRVGEGSGIFHTATGIMRVLCHARRD